jgi:threonylcarbamoyladenosine tRNA methylthiotransferase MtaB
VPRIAFHTLGCKVNQGETAAMVHLFREAGYDVVDFNDVADVYVVNSCAVTVQAERKSRQMLHRARNANPGAMLVMVGCYPQAAQGELPELSDVDLIIGSSEKPQIVELVERARAQASPLIAVSRWTDDTRYAMISTSQEVGRTRATLKVQDGCQQFCAYCIIPYARGPERSRSLDSVLDETRQLIAAGYQEVVLTGIHLGSWGRDLQQPSSLSSLAEAMLAVPGLQRLRLSSVEPNDITPELIELMRHHPNFCRHLHIPLQTGQDEILAAMNRRYNTAEYRAIVEQVRAAVPRVAITTDVIVGFPGETDEHFAETLQFVESIGFSRLHVFRYSPRPRTPAATMPNQVPGQVKEERARRLIALGEVMRRQFCQRMVGETWQVLWEQEHDGVWSGHTDTYVSVQAQSDALASNQLSPVRVVRLTDAGVFGEPV